jgi:Phage integrase family
MRDGALARPLRKYIESLSAPDDPSAPVHPKAFDLLERHHNTGNLSNQFADLLAAAGLRQKRNHKSRGTGRGSRRDVEPLSFHSLRRTASTLLHEAGVPAAVAQALIGHDSKAMHELYVSVGCEVIVSTVAITLDRAVKIDRNEFLQTLCLPSRVPLKEHVFTGPVCHPKITLPGPSVSRIEICRTRSSSGL